MKRISVVNAWGRVFGRELLRRALEVEVDAEAMFQKVKSVESERIS